MEDLNNLHSLWQSAKPIDLPDAAEIQKTIKQFQDRKLRNKVLVVIVAVVIVLLSLVVLVKANNLWISTQAAIILNVAACIVLAATNLRSMRRFIGLKDLSNLEFLQFLQQTRRNQLQYYQRTEVTGLTLISISTLLFPYQFVVGNVVPALSVYTVAIGWLLILWFYVRPRSFNKHAVKLDAEMSRFEQIIKQTV